MDISDIYTAIMILFFIGVIFFIFKKVSFIDKLEAIFICSSGLILYGCLSGGYMLNYTLIDIIWLIIALLSILVMIYFLIKKPKYLKRWEVVMFCLGECVISCVMLQSVVQNMIK